MFELTFIEPDADRKTDDDLLGYLEARFARLSAAAGRLREVGCTVEATLCGLAFEFPDAAYLDFKDVMGRLRDLGIEDAGLKFDPSRTRDEVEAALEEYDDRIWYSFRRDYFADNNPDHNLSSDAAFRLLDRMSHLEEQYGKESLEEADDLDIELLWGKTFATHWLLGDRDYLTERERREAAELRKEAGLGLEQDGVVEDDGEMDDFDTDEWGREDDEEGPHYLPRFSDN